MTGKCGSVLVRLIPAPRGTSIVAAAVPKKLLQMAGVSDCYTCARGQTATLGNFGKQVETLGSLSWLVGYPYNLRLSFSRLYADVKAVLISGLWLGWASPSNMWGLV